MIGDFNSDMNIDLTDFAILAAHFNYVAPGANAAVGASVPEPDVLMAVACCTGLALRRRRIHR
jgi:hypothetical protein